MPRKEKDPVRVAKVQAANVIKPLQGKHNVLKSQGTVRNYENALAQVALYANREFKCGLREISKEQALSYLNSLKDNDAGQKKIDMHRQAIQCMMRHTSKILSEKETLTVIKASTPVVKECRTYTFEQMQAVAEKQSEKHALATKIAFASGLRAHELATIRPIAERATDIREPQYNSDKFSQRDGVRYSVEGKGGLIREIRIPHDLANALEARRLETPESIIDRRIHYESHYDIGSGKNWSNSFSAASMRVLGWSNGGHGNRHTYAQQRMDELQRLNRWTYEYALKIVSLEMGHIRSEITLEYLR